MLVDTESNSIHDALDSFNLVLKAMVTVGVSGVREESVEEIQESLKIFEKVCGQRDPLFVRLLVGKFTGEYEGLDKSLYVKSTFTNEFLRKLGKAKP